MTATDIKNPTSCQRPPSPENVSKFRIVAQSQQEEDSYDYVQHRKNVQVTGYFCKLLLSFTCPGLLPVIKCCNMLESVAHIVKSALGAGLLTGHVAYMKAGVLVAAPLNIILGIYLTYCMYTLVASAQTLYKRTGTSSMTYSDVGEAAVACFPNPKVARYAKTFRYTIDTIIAINLFGSCACYQIIIAKSIKQLVENTHLTSIIGKGEGYPDLRVYMIIMVMPIILICLIKHLKWLAPFSVAGNIVIVFCIGLTIYYAFYFNPEFEVLVLTTNFYQFFEYIGISVFSISCAGVVMPVENSMREPQKFAQALSYGMAFTIAATFLVSFFGYAAFLNDCESPITVNFPMTMIPLILKGLIIIMIYVTHALNYWVPFNIVFYYIKTRHDQKRLTKWEMIYRAVFVILITIVAVMFPSINALMGFIGAFCISNMAFIWPNIITLLVVWHRPGLGRYNWRLWRSSILLGIGLFILICGTLVNANELIKVLTKRPYDDNS